MSSSHFTLNNWMIAFHHHLNSIQLMHCYISTIRSPILLQILPSCSPQHLVWTENCYSSMHHKSLSLLHLPRYYLFILVHFLPCSYFSVYSSYSFPHHTDPVHSIHCYISTLRLSFSLLSVQCCSLFIPLYHLHSLTSFSSFNTLQREFCQGAIAS